jgi:hypothetical protein
MAALVSGANSVALTLGARVYPRGDVGRSTTPIRTFGSPPWVLAPPILFAPSESL